LAGNENDAIDPEAVTSQHPILRQRTRFRPYPSSSLSRYHVFFTVWNLCWGGANIDDIRAYAKELVALAPDVILTGATSLTSLRQATGTVPIVFVLLVDPVGTAHVDTLARPSGNATGFMQFDTV
jgi:hypothetical protein